MNLTINNENLIMEFDTNSHFSTYQTKMIKQNNFNEFIQFKIEMFAYSNVIKYDVSNLISLDEYIANQSINCGELKYALTNIESKMKDYMLIKNNLLLESKYIYLDKNKLNNNEFVFKFVYVPTKEEQNDYEKNKNVLLENKKMFEPKHNTNELQEKLLEDLINDDEIYSIKLKTRKIIKTLLIILFLVLLFIFRKYKLATIITVISFVIGYLLFYIISFTDDEKEYQDDISDETILIQNYPYLKKGLLDEKILIMRNIFTIGKDNKNDLVINDNSVSKNHAKIIKKNSEYYVCDSNSTNHTYVNNEELQKDDCRLLISGDKIKFGREQYQFHYEI